MYSQLIKHIVSIMFTPAGFYADHYAQITTVSYSNSYIVCVCVYIYIYVIVVTWAQVVCLICTPKARGLANHKCTCYNCYVPWPPPTGKH